MLFIILDIRNERNAIRYVNEEFFVLENYEMKDRINSRFQERNKREVI